MFPIRRPRFELSSGQYVRAEAFKVRVITSSASSERSDIRGPVNFHILQIAHRFDCMGSYSFIRPYVFKSPNVLSILFIFIEPPAKSELEFLTHTAPDFAAAG